MNKAKIRSLKHGLRRVSVLVFALILTVTFTVPKTVFGDEDTKKPKATNVHYYPSDDAALKDRTGVKSFTIEPYTFYNMSKDRKVNPSGDDTMNLDDATLKRIAVNQIFPKWSVVAEGIFRDQASQLVTIEGSGMMSSSTTAAQSFDRHFSYGRKDVSGYNYNWALKDLSEELRGESYRHQGEICWDEVRREGISQIGSLADARKMMGQSLRNCSDDNDISTDEFLGNDKQKTDSKFRLPDLEDKNTGSGFCNIVTCVNRAGASGDYDYVSFGLAVYDFDLTPVAAENLKYVEAAQKYDNGQQILMGEAGDDVEYAGIKFQKSMDDGVTTYLKNNTSQEATQSTGLENSSTEENSVSQEESFEWGMEQTIGSEWNLGGFENVNCMFPRCTLSFSNSWHETWNTTKSNSQTKSVTKTKSVNTEVAMPAHSIAKINQSVENTNTEEHYQQPVVLSYKVAVFAMSGDYFNGWFGAIENSRYDKEWMSVLFDGSDNYGASGNHALGSLYNRSIINKDTNRYDGAKGKYNTWCDKGAWNKSEKINWTSVADILSKDNRDTHNIPSSATGQKSTLKQLSTEMPMMEKANMLSSKKKSITSSVDQILPLYHLGNVSVKDNKKQFDVKPGDNIYLDSLEFEAQDRQNVDFHTFNSDWGAWNLLDDNDEIIKDGSAKDEDGTVNGRVKSGVLTLITDESMSSQWIKVSDTTQFDDDTPSQKVKWAIKDDAHIITNENLVKDEPYMTPAQIAQVSVPVVQVNPKDESRNVAAIEISGNYKGKYTDPVNLASVLKATPVDTTGKGKNTVVLWEEKNNEGITVEKSGLTSFSDPGTYKVRAYCVDSNGQKVASDWVEIQALDEAKLSKIEFNKPDDLDEDDLTITKKNQTKGFDLNSYVKMYDQYGDLFKGDKPDMKFEVTDNSGNLVEGASIDHQNILNVTEEGTYKVTAKAVNADGEDQGFSISPIKLKLTEQEWLDSITLSDPPLSKNDLQLKSKNDVVKVPNLKDQITYKNQHGEIWEGKKPAVSFYLVSETTDAEMKGDNFYAYAPGKYVIGAIANGFDINTITIEVDEDPYLVIKTTDPDTLYLKEAVSTVETDLERYVDYTTQFDSKYKGDYPEVNFTLDDGVVGAHIKTVKEKDEKTGETKNVIKLEAEAEGTYYVHVTPKKASQYTEPIDDIIVNVEKERKVEYVALDLSRYGYDKGARIIEDGNCTIEDLNRYLVYYDQFGDEFTQSELEELDPEDIPVLTDYVIYPNDKGAEIVRTEEGKLNFVATQTASYTINPKYKFKDGTEDIGMGGFINIIDEGTSEEIDEAVNEVSSIIDKVTKYVAAEDVTDAQMDEFDEAVSIVHGRLDEAVSVEDVKEAEEWFINKIKTIFPGIPMEDETTTQEESTTKKPVVTTKKTPATTKSPTKAPGKVTVKKVVKKKSAKKARVTLKKVVGAAGYQIAVYKTKKNAKKNKKALVKKYTNKLTYTIKSKKLKNKKIVYVRARAYALNGRAKIFGAWSGIKKSKTK